MNLIALIVGKLVLFVGRLLGRGSSLPGMMANSISPRLLSSLKYPRDMIMVTGTNGKTSTTHYIAAIMERAGKRVVHNREGANMPQGITTILVEKTTLTGKVKADVCALEVDEGFLKSMTEMMTPKHILITNLFDDQADRFGSVEELAEKIKNSIPKSATLILNGNDPLLVKLGKDLFENKKLYFGVESFNTDNTDRESFTCPCCGRELNYVVHHYDRLGVFSCECGLKTPKLDYLATEVNLNERTFMLKDQLFKAKYGNKYFIFNMLGAIAYAKEVGVLNNIIEKVLESYEIGTGRMEEVNIGKYNTFINLVKNPAGLNQSLEYILAEAEPEFNLYLSINNKPADGEDPSWIEAGNFECLIDSGLKLLICAGEQAEYLKSVLQDKGIPMEKLEVITDPKEAVIKLTNDEVKPYILSNYTALKSIRDQIIQ